MKLAAKNGGKNSSRSYTPGRIHVSRLPKNITDDDMWVHFSRFGTLVEGRVVKTNFKNNFGFVTFADPEVVDRLIGKNSSVTQIKNGVTAKISRAWADNPGGGIQINRGGGSGSRGRGEGSAASGSSRGVRPKISLGNCVVPEHLAVLNNGGENSQRSSQCSGGVSTTAGSRIQRPPGFLFQEHTDVWGQPPAPTSSTPLPQPRLRTPPSSPVPPPLALSEGSLPPSSKLLPLSTSLPARTSSPPAPSSTVMPLPPPPATSSTPLPPPPAAAPLPALTSSPPPPSTTSSTVMPLPPPPATSSTPLPSPPSSAPLPALTSSPPLPALTSSPPPPSATSSTVMPLPPPPSSAPLPALPSSTPPPPEPLSLSEWPELKKSGDKRKWK